MTFTAWLMPMTFAYCALTATHLQVKYTTSVTTYKLVLDTILQCICINIENHESHKSGHFEVGLASIGSSELLVKTA